MYAVKFSFYKDSNTYMSWVQRKKQGGLQVQPTSPRSLNTTHQRKPPRHICPLSHQGRAEALSSHHLVSLGICRPHLPFPAITWDVTVSWYSLKIICHSLSMAWSWNYSTKRTLKKKKILKKAISNQSVKEGKPVQVGDSTEQAAAKQTLLISVLTAEFKQHCKWRI